MSVSNRRRFCATLSPCRYCRDLKAHVRRKTDGKKFILGLSELKATNEHSYDYQLLHDYAVWLVNGNSTARARRG